MLILDVTNVFRGPRRRWKVMLSYESLFLSKNRKSKTQSKSSSSPPRSTAPDVDFDSKLAAQLVTVNKSVDQKI